MNQRCSFSTCFVDFTWFLLSSQAPNFKWALSINNLMELASEWTGDRFEIACAWIEIRSWKPSKSSETTKDYDRPTDKISLSMSADLAKVLMLGMAQSSWCVFVVLVCVLFTPMMNSSIQYTVHNINSEYTWTCCYSAFPLEKEPYCIFRCLFWWVTSKEWKAQAYSSTWKFPLEVQGPVHWHSLASSSCVGPLSQTQYGLSPEIDGFFIWQMEILWGHYTCKLQPLCRELCVLCILALEIAMNLPSSFGVHTWAELRPWTVPCPRLPDICWLAKSRLRTCRRHRRLQELNALSILKFALERLTTWTSESSTRIVFLASVQEKV